MTHNAAVDIDTSLVEKITPVTACPIGPIVDVLFSRWTTPILWSLKESGRQRFGDLRRGIPTITPKVLTQRLRQLERDGLVVRTQYPEIPPRVEYEISALGYSLGDLFAHLSDWGATNLAEVEHARQRYDHTVRSGAQYTAKE